MTYVLKTTMAQFEAIHKAIDDARSNALEIKVPRQAIVNAMMDHSALFNLLHGKVVEPQIDP